METVDEKINLTPIPGYNEMVIRHGEALRLMEPSKVSIVGQINSPLVFLQKRKDGVSSSLNHLLVDALKFSITLIVDEDSAYFKQIKGQLSISDEILSKFQINSSKEWSSHDLAELIKINRRYFESKDAAMKLVTTLRNFKAKVEKEIENIKDDKANFRSLKAQKVESNLPDDFNINIPIFKGMDTETINVEIVVNQNTLDCRLVSPDLEQLIYDISQKAMSSVVSAITELCPELVIINI